MIRIQIKPLSANRAWMGRKFKSKEYISYEKEMLLRLPKFKLPPAPYKIIFNFGFSNRSADIDNPIKIIQDILQKKYKFNDKEIYELVVRKKIVKKKQEYIEFEIQTWQE